MNVPVPVSIVPLGQQQPPVYNQDEQRLKLATAAAASGNAPLTQREIPEPTDEEFRSAFNIMPRILQLLTSASHGQLHSQSVIELRAELQRCKLLLDSIPGIDNSLAQQNLALKTTKNMIATQHKLLRQYKDLDVFKMAKSDTSDKR